MVAAQKYRAQEYRTAGQGYTLYILDLLSCTLVYYTETVEEMRRQSQSIR
jgi:hypothetical protein